MANKENAWVNKWLQEQPLAENILKALAGRPKTVGQLKAALSTTAPDVSTTEILATLIALEKGGKAKKMLSGIDKGAWAIAVQPTEKVERFSTRTALNAKLDDLKAKGIAPKVAKIPAGGFEVSWTEK
jgi:hypothetical protein